MPLPLLITTLDLGSSTLTPLSLFPFQQVSIVALIGNGMNDASGVSYGIDTHGINGATDSVSFRNGIGNGGMYLQQLRPRQ
jgi:hypothetical protein